MLQLKLIGATATTVQPHNRHKAAGATQKQRDNGEAIARAEAQIAQLHAERALVCFTDGSCTPAKGWATGAAAVVYTRLRGEVSRRRSRSLGASTNNVGELTAVGLALDLVRESLEKRAQEPSSVSPLLQQLQQPQPPRARQAPPTLPPIAILTDSSYAIGVLTNPRWQPAKNVELIQRLKTQMQCLQCSSGREIRLLHVPAHCSIDDNELADRLAKAAARGTEHDYVMHDVSAPGNDYILPVCAVLCCPPGLLWRRRRRPRFAAASH